MATSATSARGAVSRLTMGAVQRSCYGAASSVVRPVACMSGVSAVSNNSLPFRQQRPQSSWSSLRPHKVQLNSCGRRAPRGQVVVQASWGAPVEFSAAKVVSNKQLAAGLHQVVLDVGASTASGYTVPGQYIQAKTSADAKAGFFAIASAPDPNNQGVIELLIKSQPGSTAEAITQLAAGAELMVSPVQGKGFPLDRIPAANYPSVYMFATGSGISPIKAVIESGQLGQRKDVRLYYGTRSPEHTAYLELIPEWERQGVKVVQVYSGPEPDVKQYVQDVFAKDTAALSQPQGVGILLCGQKGMAIAVTELAKGAGVEHVLSNF